MPTKSQLDSWTAQILEISKTNNDYDAFLASLRTPKPTRVKAENEMTFWETFNL